MNMIARDENGIGREPLFGLVKNLIKPNRPLPSPPKNLSIFELLSSDGIRRRDCFCFAAARFRILRGGAAHHQLETSLLPNNFNAIDVDSQLEANRRRLLRTVKLIACH